MTKMETRDGDGFKAVRMYPDNRLPQQVRDVSETVSVFSVVKKAFETNA